MTRLEQLAIEAALNKMYAQGYFSICTIDEILKVTRIVPDGKAYGALRLLHCVHYKDMSRELLEEMQMGLARVFGGPVLNGTGLNLVTDRATNTPRLVVNRPERA